MTHACANHVVICNRDLFTLHTFLQDEELGTQVDAHANNIVLVILCRSSSGNSGNKVIS